MSHSNRTLMSFYCGICTKQLTDATALFTSCGHFFCAAPASACTQLEQGNRAGRCEQCGQTCDAALLTNRAERYDERVQLFVFSDIPRQLRTMSEVIEVCPYASSLSITFLPQHPSRPHLTPHLLSISFSFATSTYKFSEIMPNPWPPAYAP